LGNSRRPDPARYDQLGVGGGRPLCGELAISPKGGAAGGRARDKYDDGQDEDRAAHPPPPRGDQGGPTKISDAFVPPKPNESDSAARIGRFRALWGTRSMSQPGEGLSRLRVGGAIPSRNASIEKIASTLPA